MRVLLGLGLLAQCVLASGPGLLPYQGRIEIAGTNLTGTAQFKFVLVTTNHAGAQSLWSHDGTSVLGAEPSGVPVTLAVTRGVFSAGLGDTNIPGMDQPLSASAFVAPELYLRTWVNVGSGGWQALSPDCRLVSVPYALSAERFGGQLAGDVTGPQGTTSVSTVGGVSAADVAAATAALRDATDQNASATMVRRDADGTIRAGTIVAAFVGNGAGLTNLAAARIIGTCSGATQFATLLAGDTAGMQSQTVVTAVGGMPAAVAAAGVAAANAATTALSAGQLVARDICDAGFAAGVITADGFAGNGSGLTNLPATSVQVAPPSGAVVVSVHEIDPDLIAGGYRKFMSQPSPAWVNGTTVDAPTPRSGHSAIWNGEHLLVWGGRIGVSSYSATGSSYDPDADTWTAVTPINAPSARAGHTAVWTGSEMIVWGGLGRDGFLNSGARFSPSSQTWTSLPTSGAPAERCQHVGVWTGSYLLVWGGRNLSGLLDDGALYDPVANRWTLLALPAPPEKRMPAVAVWAGDRFLVWGGIGESGSLNSGSELRFSLGQPVAWTALPLADAPSPRSQCTAVWTGDQMIVWGGQDGGGPLGDGAGYRPSEGRWIGVSQVQAPAARFDHAAVWSGSEMLILAGANAGGDLSSHAAYDPVTQEWRSLSSAGGPLARSQAVAVWAEPEVLVFGGSAAGQLTASLQRLLPTPAWHFYRKL